MNQAVKKKNTIFLQLLLLGLMAFDVRISVWPV